MRECNSNRARSEQVAQNLLYLDPWSGISGDMTLAALLDLGGPAAAVALTGAVHSLGLKDVAVEIKRDSEWGIACTRVTVHDEQAPPLRHLSDMLAFIEGAALSATVKAQAQAAVRRLAEVEAGVHGCSVDEIHFHEVGAADTLVDIVGAFALVEALGIDQVFVGTIPVGGGTVEIAHGRMGVPAPATAALLAGYQAVGGPEMRELTTPTGALLVGQLGAKQGTLPAMTVKAIGYGAGTMKLQHGPNVLRAVLGEAATGVGPAPGGQASAGGGAATEAVVELQTNLDDVSPEVVGYTLRRLREAGALDAWTVPVQMKKDRPGFVLHALVTAEDEAAAVDMVFAETGTLGIRRVGLARYVAQRGVLKVDVAGHEVAVKRGRWGERVSLAPEYEDAARAAAAAGLPLRQVMQEAAEAARGATEGAGQG
jgi:pyridinium-3,5-bisthiocarboxylic acid mononucleotide nickel chelatase